VGFATAVEIVALNNTSKAFAFGNARDLNFITGLKGGNVNSGTDFQIQGFINGGLARFGLGMSGVDRLKNLRWRL
jgi:hypothetical protein